MIRWLALHRRIRGLIPAIVRNLQGCVWAVLVLAVAAILLLPLSANKCYLDEKALLVGGAQPSVSQTGCLDVCLTVHRQLLAAGTPRDFVSLVQDAAHAAAPFTAKLAFHQHAFSASLGGPLARSSSSSRSGSSFGGNSSSSGDPLAAGACRTLHTVVRSRRGEGSEGYLLLIPLNSSAPAAATLAAAAGVALAGHLQRSSWLAKDAVLLFADTASCTAEESAEAWMLAYSGPQHLFGFPRAGLLQQALVLEVAAAAAADGASSAELSVHGRGGLLPNLDLYFLVKRTLELHTSLPPVSLRAATAPPPRAATLAAAALASLASSPPLRLAPAAAAQRYASELLTAAAFAGQLAAGEATGAHAAFLSRQVDAATLVLRFAAAAEPGGGSRQAASSSVKAKQRAQLAASSTLTAAELVLRTFNNLQERLHHSTSLYVLVSPARFVGVAAYLAPPACLLLAAALQLIEARRATHAAAPGMADPSLRAATWKAAWLQVAAAHALASAAGAVTQWAGFWLAGTRPGKAAAALLLQQLLWPAAAGVAAAVGLPAAMAALQPDSGGDSGGDEQNSEGAQSSSKGSSKSSRQDGTGAIPVQRCTRVAGLAVVLLQGTRLLLNQWARCLALLLWVLPLYTLWPAGSCPAGTRGPRLRSGLLLLPLLAAGALLWRVGGTAPWLVPLVLPHLLLFGSALLSGA
ncbi:Glycosylphosphatidylinositol anchor attachment 1 protein [Chlorella vulgaris]